MKKFLFNNIILGGTFDHFHKGHEKFLKQAFNLSKFVYCGIVKKQFQNKKFPHSIQTYKQRLKEVKNFINKNKLQSRIKIFSINNQFSDEINNPSLEAIIITKDTLKGAKLFNQKRESLGLPVLKIINITLLKDKKGLAISSTRIRKGEIDRLGHSYLSHFTRTLNLPKKQRQLCKRPISKLIKDSHPNLGSASLKIKKTIFRKKHPLIISVGDIVTYSLKLQKIPLDLAIVDFKSHRKPIDIKIYRSLFKIKTKFITINNPGSIDKKLVHTLYKAISKALISTEPQKIFVHGEEDLAVLPLILLSPLNSLVFYGQPEKGIVKVQVTEQTKLKAIRLLKKFHSTLSS